MNPTFIGALIGGGILFVAILFSLISGRKEVSAISLFSPKLKAVIFTRPGRVFISRVDEIASVVWSVNPSMRYLADERAVTYVRTVRMFGFMQGLFPPKMQRAVTIAKGDAFPLTLSAGAGNDYRLNYGDIERKKQMVDTADELTRAEEMRRAEREDQKGGLKMISWALFIGMIASTGVFIWLMAKAAQAGVI